MSWPLQAQKTKFHQIYQMHPAFSEDLLKKIISTVEQDNNKLQEAKVSDSSNKSDDGEGIVKPSVRRTKVKFLESTNEKYDFLYRSLTDAIHHANANNYRYNLTYLEELQVGRYEHTDQGYYNWHVDEGLIGSWDNNIRKLSFSLLLSEPNIDFEGGEFHIKIQSEHHHVKMNKGTITFFPSNVLHRVTPVTRGVRQSIVGWVKGPNWV